LVVLPLSSLILNFIALQVRFATMKDIHSPYTGMPDHRWW
jgi:hypothetical protein